MLQIEIDRERTEGSPLPLDLPVPLYYHEEDGGVLRVGEVLRLLDDGKAEVYATARVGAPSFHNADLLLVRFGRGPQGEWRARLEHRRW